MASRRPVPVLSRFRFALPRWRPAVCKLDTAAQVRGLHASGNKRRCRSISYMASRRSVPVVVYRYLYSSVCYYGLYVLTKKLKVPLHYLHSAYDGFSHVCTIFRCENCRWQRFGRCAPALLASVSLDLARVRSSACVLRHFSSPPCGLFIVLQWFLRFVEIGRVRGGAGS